MNLKEYINERIESAVAAKNKAEEGLINAPEGSLIVRYRNGNDRYFCRIQNSKFCETYLGQKDDEIIKKLQEKAYYQKLKKTAEQELAALEKIKKIAEKMSSYEEVYLKLPENKKHLITPYVSDEDEKKKNIIAKECKRWAREALVRRGVSKEINLYTVNGERVRSKSELIIADRLKAANVPYYYEGQYNFINDKTKDFETWFPDFQAYNTRTGELFFWEHFGLMDNPEYCASCQYKLETYAKHGIIMGKNLIVSMESSMHSMNTEYVDCLIREFLI